MPFANFVHEVIRLSAGPPAAGTAESAEKSAKGMSTSGGNDAAVDYLKKLPEDVVMKLQTLMFLGKDGYTNIHNLHEHFRGLTRDKTEAIRAMTSRVSLPEYLGKALKLAEKHGIDLEVEF
jgi:hypothetical protein